MNKNRKGFFILIGIVCIAFLVLMISIFSRKADTSENMEYIFEEGNTGFFAFGSPKIDDIKSIKTDYIAVIYIRGVITEAGRNYNQKWLLKKIKSFKSDPKNRGIMLFVNSPGGGVYESDDAYLALLDYKNETGRPVYAYFGQLAASGGYYIGCAADRIFANRNCLTGSIGVIAGQSFDATELFEKIGVKMTTITAGRNKNMGNINSSLTDEQRAIIQSLADEAYDQFTGIVAESRKMNIDDVKKLADGRVYSALQAKKNGLIDEICTVEQAKNIIKNTLNSEKLEFIDFKYEYTEDIFSLFSSISTFIGNPKATVDSFVAESATRPLYLYQ